MVATKSEPATSNGQAKQGHFSVEVRDDYIHLVTRGPLDIENLEAPANAALELAKAKKIDKLLDDIRYIDSSGASIAVQSKGFGILWKLREFRKVAIVFKEKRIGKLFFSTLETIHLTSRFNGFTNEADAIAWLKDERSNLV